MRETRCSVQWERQDLASHLTGRQRLVLRNFPIRAGHLGFLLQVPLSGGVGGGVGSLPTGSTRMSFFAGSSLQLGPQRTARPLHFLSPFFRKGV